MAAKSKAPAFNPPKGRLPVLQYLPPAELRIDGAYQREIENSKSHRLIAAIARDWDWALCQPLVVSDRNGAGELYVIDGQHRLAAAKLRGDIAQLPCVVLAYTGAHAEAASFVALNQARRPLHVLEIYRAALASGDPDVMAIQKAVDRAGLRIASHDNAATYKPGVIANIGGLRKAYRQHGYDVLREALGVLADAFVGQRLQYAGTLFLGVVAAVAAQPKDASVDLVPVMKAKGQAALYAAIMKARVDDLTLDTPRASALVIRRLLAEVRGEPEGGANPVLKLGLFKDGRAWCAQCDMRVSIGQAQGCKSRHCKVKV